MNIIKLSKETKESLVGKTIISCGDDYLTLDNGCRIYLDDSEIDNLGSEKISNETSNN